MTLLKVAICAALALCDPQDPKKARVFKQAAEMDYGPWIAATVGAGKDNVTPKGIVIRVDPEKQAYVLFDTELLRVSAAWTGGWLHLAGRVYADDSNDYSLVKGEIQYSSLVRPGWGKGANLDDPRTEPRDGPLPADWAKFRGLYLHGERIVLSYTVGSCAVLESHGLERQGDKSVFTRTFNLGPSESPLTLLVAEGARGLRMIGVPPGTKWELVGERVYLKLAIAPTEDETVTNAAGTTVEDLKGFTKGGPARWTMQIATKGIRGKDDGPYVVDTLTAPEQNPYKSWMRFTGLDFFADGRAALCTWSGDVWIVSGIDDSLETLTWKRFAAGIGQPMGLKIVDGVIYTTARDQITRLHDLNGDGEADYYECFNNDIKLTTNFHEFCFDLQTDREGNFYCSKGSSIWAGSQRMTDHNGTICKISKDGSKLEILATGLRAPNGVGVSPTGEVLCTDNQGNWVPECPINLIRPGGYYGFAGQGQKAKEREKPICWIPMSVDKSSGGLVWVPDDRWGPLKGQLILNSYDCSMSLVIIERLGSEVQGGVVKFPFRFPSGVMRGRFNPVDGQHYVAGLRGWSSSAAKDCAFQRVRYTGKPVCLPVQVSTRKGGMDITFTSALEAASVNDPENIGAVGFNVVRTGGYGSPEFSLKDPKKQGRDPIDIKSSKLLADGKTVSLEIPDLKSLTNLVLKFRVKAADGAPVSLELDYTLHRVPE